MNKQRFIIHLFAFFLAGIIFQISTAGASPVGLMDSSYHVWGDYYYEYDYILQGENVIPLSTTDTYDFSSTTPINEGYDINYMYCNSSPAKSTALSQGYEFGLEVETDADWDEGRANALAEAEWTFKPVNNIEDLVINYSYNMGSGFAAFGVLFNDQTTGTMLGNYVGGMDGLTQSYPHFAGAQFVGDWDGDLNFNNLISGNQYNLYFWAWSNANDDSELFTIEVADLHSVPEPENMILLGSGLVLIAGLGREFRKRQNRSRK